MEGPTANDAIVPPTCSRPHPLHAGGNRSDRTGTIPHMTEAEQRLTVSEAAEALGISSEAVRTRIQRGTLRSVRDGGRVFVLFDADMTQSNTDRTGDQTAVADELRARVDSLERQLDLEREANRENRRLLAAALERIPALEPPGDPETPSETPPETQTPPDRETPTEARPWWRRIFGSG
jgi:excisionase family DNA binding protein